MPEESRAEPSTRASTMSGRIRKGPEAKPDIGLSCGEVVLDSLKKWQHLPGPAQIDGHFGTSMSYRELLEQTVHAAEGFKALGLATKDVVALVSRNCHEMVPAVLGAVCAGLTVACVVPAGNLAEMRHALTLTQPKVVISERDRVRLAMDAYPDGRHIVLSGEAPEGAGTFLNVLRMGETAEPRPDPDTYSAADVGDRTQHAPFILYSSGTTGLPKAVMLRDTSLTAFIGNTPHKKDGDSDILLVSSPLSWISGVWLLLWSLKLGVCRAMFADPDPFTLMSAIQKFKIVSWLTSPLVLAALHDVHQKHKHRYDISSFRMAVLGGSVVDAKLQTALEHGLQCKVLQGYGCTEAGSVFGVTARLPPPGSMGDIVPGVEVRLVNVDTGEDIPADVKNAVGEVRVRSRTLMLGYYNNPEETLNAFDEYGFYKTGDLAYEDEDGFFFFVDRLKELIKHRSHHIAPAEVEMTLMLHPGVKEACVLGRPCTTHGELPTAFVSRTDSKAGEAVTEVELQDLVADKMSDYKRLRGGVIFLEELPKTATGKVERRRLKEMLRGLD